METRSPITVLMDELENAIASPVAMALRDLIMAGERSSALDILDGEGFGGDDAGVIYEHLKKMLLGEPLMFEEIEKDAWLSVVTPISDETPERFLVRYGCEVFTSEPYVQERGGISFYKTGGGAGVKLEKVDQLWRMVPKQ
jgi:hypothetical protein